MRVLWKEDVWQDNRHLIHSMTRVGDEVWCAAVRSSDIQRLSLAGRTLGSPLTGHSGMVNQLLSVGRYVWSCSWDKQIIIWDVRTHRPYVLDGHHNDSVTCMTCVTGTQRCWVWSSSASMGTSPLNPPTLTVQSRRLHQRLEDYQHSSERQLDRQDRFYRLLRTQSHVYVLDINQHRLTYQSSIVSIRDTTMQI